jgi:hypothetical protein
MSLMWTPDMNYSDLKDIVNDTCETVYIDTPEDWVCDKKGCKTDFMHTHGTYPSLLEKTSKDSGDVARTFYPSLPPL